MSSFFKIPFSQLETEITIKEIYTKITNVFDEYFLFPFFFFFHFNVTFIIISFSKFENARHFSTYLGM